MSIYISISQNALEMGELMTKEEFDNFSYDVGDQHFTTIEKQLEAGEYLWNNKNVNAYEQDK